MVAVFFISHYKRHIPRYNSFYLFLFSFLSPIQFVFLAKSHSAFNRRYIYFISHKLVGVVCYSQLRCLVPAIILMKSYKEGSETISYRPIAKKIVDILNSMDVVIFNFEVTLVSVIWKNEVTWKTIWVANNVIYLRVNYS